MMPQALAVGTLTDLHTLPTGWGGGLPEAGVFEGAGTALLPLCLPFLVGAPPLQLTACAFPRLWVRQRCLGFLEESRVGATPGSPFSTFQPRPSPHLLPLLASQHVTYWLSDFGHITPGVSVPPPPMK